MSKINQVNRKCVKCLKSEHMTQIIDEMYPQYVNTRHRLCFECVPGTIEKPLPRDLGGWEYCDTSWSDSEENEVPDEPEEESSEVA